MASSDDHLFLQIAVRNKLLTEAESQEILQALSAGAAPGAPASAAGWLRARNRIPEEIIRKIEAALQGRSAAAGSGILAKPTGAAGSPPTSAPKGADASPATRPVPRSPENEGGKTKGAGPPPGPGPGRRPATERAAPPPSGRKDEVIPGFKVVGKVGTGGMATVFRAVEVRTGKSVALKILLPAQAANAQSLSRFQRESRLLVQIQHPNIVRGVAAGQHGPLHYVAMELIEGPSVQQILDFVKGPLDESTALDIILQIARGLDHIESLGYVHRDVKPDNVLIDRRGLVKLCDLGFAQPMARGGEAAGTETMTSGTAAYMSPEQARGQRDIDIRSDIYSLGATLYHLVMGETPFKGTDSLDLMAKQVMEAIKAGEIKNRRVSTHMHYFIERMMSKDKEYRYASCAELIQSIEEQIQGFRSLHFDPTGATSTHSGTLADLVERTHREIGNRPSGPGPASSARDRLTKRLQQLTRRMKRR